MSRSWNVWHAKSRYTFFKCLVVVACCRSEMPLSAAAFLARFLFLFVSANLPTTTRVTRMITAIATAANIVPTKGTLTLECESILGISTGKFPDVVPAIALAFQSALNVVRTLVSVTSV